MIRKVTQFRLSSLLILTTLLAGYIAWQVRDVDGNAIEAIKASGGVVHLNRHAPTTSSSFISVAMMPDYVYCNQVRVLRRHPAEARRPTLWELFLGVRDNRVRMIEMSLSQLKPDIIQQIKSLDDLNLLILRMPQPVFAKESDTGRKLSKLERQFPNKVYPTFDSGTLIWN